MKAEKVIACNKTVRWATLHMTKLLAKNQIHFDCPNGKNSFRNFQTYFLETSDYAGWSRGTVFGLLRAVVQIPPRKKFESISALWGTFWLIGG